MFKRLVPALTADESNILKSYMKAGNAPIGSIIMELGDRNKDIFFMISGSYEIYQRVDILSSPNALRIASLEGANILGEMNLFLSDSRQATVVATSECKYFKISHDKLEELLEENPIIAAKLYQQAGKILTTRLKSVQDNIYDRMIHTAENTHIAIKNMNKYIGPTKKCSIALARKLFPTKAS
ncbi:MAG: hypothetical protein CMF61_03945 [Magnetococcales bacterium]|nr:hypothetical protein [Magnetococcales bacterium]PPR19600.1 MAG: hypothetical protein CFH43_00100 [Pseudomonadota bacterium]